MIPSTDGRNLLLVDRRGTIHDTIPAGTTTPHGLRVVDGPDPVVWVADAAIQLHPRRNDVPVVDRRPGQVVAIGLDGVVRCRISAPPGVDPVTWSPTAVAVETQGNGGANRVWIADGYGLGTIGTWSADGTHETDVAAPDGTPHWAEPHDVVWLPGSDDRTVGRLVVAERGRSRLVEVTATGTHPLDTADALARPSGVLMLDGGYVVADLARGLVALDAPVDAMSIPPHALARPGWPNALDDQGTAVAPHPSDDAVDSPHAIARLGSELFITEWVLGGRILATTLRPK